MRTILIGVSILLELLIQEHSLGEIAFLKHTSSPNGKVVIAEEPNSEGGKSFFFYERDTKLKRGSILSSMETEGIRSITILASWNSDSTKVAILILYGSKLSELQVYELISNRQLKKVNFPKPDPVEVFKSQNSAELNVEGVTGFDANSLGSWKGKDTVSLVVGDAKEFDGGTTFLLAKFQVHIENKGAVVQNVKSLGKLSEKEADAFFTKWGKQYSTRIEQPTRAPNATGHKK